MIHIATVHHLKTDWIEIQRRYLDRFMSAPFRVYASLEGISDEFHRFFDVVVPSKGPHAGKLNLLGQVISKEAEPDDLIYFVDGDSFPIADPVQPVEHLLQDAALAAVCRLENKGDRQPHPCFCAVPVDVWDQLRGDWSSGFLYDIDRSDVGANLLYILESTETKWARILRSNGRDLHPVLFGIYGGFWYHHGAGFREFNATRGDPKDGGTRTALAEMQQTLRFKRLEEKLGAEEYGKMVARSLQNAHVSEQLMNEIRTDPDFFQQLL
jgi:hypothetical protein